MGGSRNIWKEPLWIRVPRGRGDGANYCATSRKSLSEPSVTNRTPREGNNWKRVGYVRRFPPPLEVMQHFVRIVPRKQLSKAAATVPKNTPNRAGGGAQPSEFPITYIWTLNAHITIRHSYPRTCLPGATSVCPSAGFNADARRNATFPL